MAGSASPDRLSRRLPKAAAKVSRVSTRIANVSAAAVQTSQAQSLTLKMDPPANASLTTPSPLAPS